MKKIWLPLLAVLLLCACGGENDRAEELQEQYQKVSSYETDVRVCVPREDETVAYCLHLSAQGDTVRAEVKEPQELAGVGAVLEGERLSLTFDGLVLDVGTLSPRVSALNCVPMLLRAFPKAYLDSFGTETLGGEIVLHVDFSLSSGSARPISRSTSFTTTSGTAPSRISRFVPMLNWLLMFPGTAYTVRPCSPAN